MSEITDSVGHVPFGDSFKEQLFQAEVITYDWFLAYVSTLLHETCPEAITPEK